MCQVFWIRCAAISGFLAVALGAFGAHALKASLEASGSLGTWQTATLYHLVHAAVMLAPVSYPPRRFPPALFFLVGTLLFSGSLYALALLKMPMLGVITPFGGLFFLAGWLNLAWKPLDRSNISGGGVPPNS